MIRLRQHIIPAIKQKIAEFNLFEDDTVNDDGETFEIRSQRITTRLYIVLIIVCVTILTFYLSLVPVLRVETVKDPSSGQFIDLQYRFPFSLQCACSSISIPYHIFLTIETQYHQMCSSDLVSETMLYLLGINSLLPRDNNLNYGRSAGSRFRLLDELCTQAQRTVNSSLQRFLEQTMVTAQVISRDLFELQTNSSVDNWKKTTVNSFIRTLDVIRAMEHGNHLAFADINARFDLNVSTYQFLLYSSIYYDGCNCMLSASCHVPMYVYSIWDQSPVFDAMDISNFFHGCSTIEGLFKSTLECFYNQTCMDAVNSLTLLPRYQDFYPVNFTALNATRNLPNETIESVVNRLFVDAWLTSSSFDSYYAVCDPSVCTYEYTTRRDFVYLITKIIGIVGGLTTGLKILLSIALRSATKVSICCCPFSSFEIDQLPKFSIKQKQILIIFARR